MSSTPLNGGSSRAVNEKIRELAQTFADAVGDDESSEYYCECGCGERVALTRRQFDSPEPALIPGHALPPASGA